MSQILPSICDPWHRSGSSPNTNTSQSQSLHACPMERSWDTRRVGSITTPFDRQFGITETKPSSRETWSLLWRSCATCWLLNNHDCPATCPVPPCPPPLARSNVCHCWLQSGLDEKWWTDSVECYCYLRNIQDLLSDGAIWRTSNTVWCDGRTSSHFCEGHIVRLHQFEAKVLISIFLDYASYVEEILGKET